RKISSSAQAWREAHLYFRSARPRVRQGKRGPSVRENRHAASELRHQTKGKEPRGQLLLPLYEGERRSTARDHPPHRCWPHPLRDGPGLPVRINQRGHGVRRRWPCKRQGCRQGEIIESKESS